MTMSLIFPLYISSLGSLQEIVFTVLLLLITIIPVKTRIKQTNAKFRVLGFLAFDFSFSSKKILDSFALHGDFFFAHGIDKFYQKTACF
jgi:hypothetical protein